ncbi:uncharacterized protein FOMMEDRAFT_139606 [Fomitiporia mediterranea MF3/22]|uniref:uncharacterized protein n=1 Tax=Fomitiporia mediterranea (strain MF3/22) TaxID=694068 RepID=UPI0004407E88|nr:uncharacterized protein FOMMEDRAFT_139606 [Fomitiporia mediterranea MF3/22]EJD04978.1 hypothetical protein FOMMEDRAFT_139606 [Fomitiporia mediterranea MF3/22]
MPVSPEYSHLFPSHTLQQCDTNTKPIVDADGDLVLSSPVQQQTQQQTQKHRITTLTAYPSFNTNPDRPPSITNNMPVSTPLLSHAPVENTAANVPLPIDQSTALTPTSYDMSSSSSSSTSRLSPATLKHGMPSSESTLALGSSDCEFGSESDDEVGGAYVPGKRSRRNNAKMNAGTSGKQRGLRVTDDCTAERERDGRRPYKRARIDDGNLGIVEDGDVDVVGDIRMSRSRSSSATALGEEDDDARKERGRVQKKYAHTLTPEREQENTMSTRMSLSPLPRPSYSRFQSSGSTSSSGSPFPSSPPSNGSATTSSSTFAFNPSLPQPFWFDDGDLVVFVSTNPVSSSLASNSIVSSASTPFAPASSRPPSRPSSHTPSSSVSSIYSRHESPPPSTSAFRIHAARLALASSAFASLLSSPLLDSPTKEDSARAAREIAVRLASGRGHVSESKTPTSMFDRRCREEGRRARRERDGEGEDECEYAGGCPAIRLEGDTPRDWNVALEAIYEPMSFQVRPMVFDTLSSALRISTRYGLRQLREWTIAQLRTTWPSNIERMAPVALPHAADAIALARACDVPEILPAAFYALSVQRWRPSPVHCPGPNAVSSMRSPAFPSVTTTHPTGLNSSSNLTSGAEAGGTDGGRAHLVLDPTDLRRLVAGREALQDVLVEIIACPLVVGATMRSGEDEGDIGPGDELAIRGIGSGVGINGNTRFPLSPAPSPSPRVSAADNNVPPAIPSPPLSTVSGTTSVTLVSVSSDSGPSSSGLYQPAASVPPSSSFSSFSALPSSSSAFSMSSMTISFGFFSNNLNSDGVSTPPPQRTPHFTFCPHTATCRTALEGLWRTRLAPTNGMGQRRAWGTWLARELHRLATLPRQQYLSQIHGHGSEDLLGYSGSPGLTLGGEVEMDGPPGSGKGKENGSGGNGGNGEKAVVCTRCWEENRRLALWRLDWLCAAIPGMFCL